MTQKVSVHEQCPECAGTGIFSGMYEPKGTGVVCSICQGTGGRVYTFTPFIERSKNRNHLVVVPGANSMIGTAVKTTKEDPKCRGITVAEGELQQWDTPGTVYDMRNSTASETHYLIRHPNGSLAWYGHFEFMPN
jgi:DnaJ-class molecular chaperone